ncbi:hypothetical protein PV797_16525 [Clostridiaceae bacterium M8S5]|nr:hypothetical protein PV797_16525 [Clostridiaceae bacterium M8S5]
MYSEIYWLGNVERYLGEIQITSSNDIYLGCYGGNVMKGLIKTKMEHI